MDENNVPLPQKMFGYIRYQVNVSADGLVVIDSVVPGKYTLQKMAGNRRMTYNVTNFDVEIRPGETKHWDLTAPNGVKVVARIRLPDDYEGEFTAEDWNASQFRLSVAPDENGRMTMSWLERIRPSENDPREGVIEIEHVVPGSGHWDIGLYKYKKPAENTPYFPTQESLVGTLFKPVVIPESTDAASKELDLGTIKVTRFKPKP